MTIACQSEITNNQFDAKKNREYPQLSFSDNIQDNSSMMTYKKESKYIIEYIKIDTVLFDIGNDDPEKLGRSKMGDNGWSYAEVLNDSILFAYDDFYFNMKLLNLNTQEIDTVVQDYVNYDFHSFIAIRGELFRHANTMLYRFDSKLNLKDSIIVSENLSEEYAQCDFIENSHATPSCLDILYPEGFKRTEIKKQELTDIPYLERVSDSTLQYGINLYKVKPLPINTTFIVHYKNKIYSVYSLANKYMLLIHYYKENLKGY